MRRSTTIAGRPWAIPAGSWKDLLPLFVKIETDVDFGDQPIHGKSGPIVIQRYRPESWAPVNRVMYEACVELGVREAPDLNGLDAHAGVVGAMPHNRYKEVRLGTLVTYIRQARRRPNLTIRAGAVVDHLVLSGRRADGVVYLDNAGRPVTALAGEMVISAGVYNSPAILQRSGIGPSAWLNPLGIKVVADLPVGRNLLDHPGFGMMFKGKGLGVTTGRSFVADVRGPADANGEPAWQTHPAPVDEEEGIACLWTYLTRQDAAGRSRHPEQGCAPAAAHRPPLQHPRTGPQEFRRRPGLLPPDARHRDFSAARRDVDRRHEQADRRSAGRRSRRRPSPGRNGEDGERRAIRPRSSGRICGSTASTICGSPTPASIPTM